MKRLSILMMIVLSMVLVACNAVTGNGDVTTRTVDVSEFEKMQLSLSGQALVSVGDTQSVEITTDSNLQDLLVVEVRGDTLHIGLQNNTAIANPTEMTFTVVVPRLNEVNVSGSGTVIIDDFTTDEMTFNVSGSGDVEMDSLTTDTLNISVSGSGNVTINDLEAASVEVSLSGSGNVILGGETQDLDVSVSGSGNAVALELEATIASATIRGSGTAQVNVSDSLTGSISGSGNLIYRGNADVDVNVSGSGEITDVN
ncbi:MAG: head GIN domain-containing protein [Chloroflexota bacterium]